MQMTNGALCALAVAIFPANPALCAASVLFAGTCSANISSSAPPARGPARMHDELLSGAATLAGLRRGGELAQRSETHQGAERCESKARGRTGHATREALSSAP